MASFPVLLPSVMSLLCINQEKEGGQYALNAKDNMGRSIFCNALDPNCDTETIHPLMDGPLRKKHCRGDIGIPILMLVSASREEMSSCGNKASNTPDNNTSITINNAHSSSSLAMPKLTGKRSAAKAREAAKRGEITPAEGASLNADPTYVDVPPDNPQDVATGSKRARDESGLDTSQAPPEKIAREDRDLVHDRKLGTSRSAIYRNKKGLTKKAKDKIGQTGITRFFTQTPLVNIRSKAEIEAAESDSDIEIIDQPNDNNSEPPPLVLDHDLFSEYSEMHVEDNVSERETPTPTASTIDAQMSWMNSNLAAEPLSSPPSISIPLEAEDSGGVPPSTGCQDAGDGPSQPSIEETDELDGLPDPADTEDSEFPKESESTNSPEDFHARLKKLIITNEKELRKPKRALSDIQAVNRLFDLEALKRYNGLRLGHAQKLRRFHQKISDAPPREREKMRAELPRIRPSTDASLTVADAAGKGPYYAKQLRKMADFLLRKGSSPSLLTESS
ncbi:hypothetical protein K438DRAFT_2097586 [Mycena galopus ATCC 62051]|nr:hypothetical protein K438DRAFT_2097586 [Mycena galopus ATCC 62051]